MRKFRLFRVTTRFTSVEDLKQALSECFPNYFVNRNASNIQVGYVSPGHGVRGMQHWLSDDRKAYWYYLHRRETANVGTPY